MINSAFCVLTIMATTSAVVAVQLRHTVYGESSGSSVNNVRQLRSVHFNDMEDTPEVEQNSKTRLKTLSEYLKIYSDRFQELIENMKKLDEVLKPVKSDKRCLNDQNICPENSAQDYRRCYFHCELINAQDSHLVSWVDYFIDMIDNLCKPLITEYEGLFNKSAGRETFKSYKMFRDLLEINDKMVKTRVSQFGNALIWSILQNVKTPYSPLAHMFKHLRKYLEHQFPGANFPFQNNPNCYDISPYAAYQVFAHGLTNESSFENLMLPGYLILTTATKYINAKASLKLTALIEINRLLTGSVSGFGCTPGAANFMGSERPEQDLQDKTSPHDGAGLCDELGKAPTLGFPIPPILNDGVLYTSIAPNPVECKPSGRSSGTNAKLHDLPDSVES